MSAEQFVEGVHIAVYLGAIHGVEKSLTDPPGQRPPAELVRLSQWFNGLDAETRENVRAVVRLTADHATFGFLAVLDGVRAVAPKPTPVEVRFGSELISPDGDLHDIFRAIVDDGPND